MALVIGLMLFSTGLYLFNLKIRKDKSGISIFNMYWKSKRNGFIYLLLFGGLIMCIRELILLVKGINH